MSGRTRDYRPGRERADERQPPSKIRKQNVYSGTEQRRSDSRGWSDYEENHSEYPLSHGSRYAQQKDNRRRSPGSDRWIDQNKSSHSPSEKWDPPPRGKGMSQSQGRSRSRERRLSRSRSHGRAASPIRGRERDRSRSPFSVHNRLSYTTVDRSGSTMMMPTPPPCKYFAAGLCRKGTQCTFSHADIYENNLEQPRRRGNNRSDYNHRDEAADFDDNYERGGNRDYDLKHQRPIRSGICKDFANGKCHRDNCRFSHDDPVAEDRRGRNHDDRMKSWNGPTWDDRSNSKTSDFVKTAGSWGDRARDDPVIADTKDSLGSRESAGWDERSVRNPRFQDGENRGDDRRSKYSNEKSKAWDGPTWDDAKDSSDASKVSGWRTNIQDPNPMATDEHRGDDDIWGRPKNEQRNDDNKWGHQKNEQLSDDSKWGHQKNEQRNDDNKWGHQKNEKRNDDNKWGRQKNEQRVDDGIWGRPKNEQRDKDDIWGSKKNEQRDGSDIWGHKKNEQRDDEDIWGPKKSERRNDENIWGRQKNESQNKVKDSSDAAKYSNEKSKVWDGPTWDNAKNTSDASKAGWDAKLEDPKPTAAEKQRDDNDIWGRQTNESWHIVKDSSDATKSKAWGGGESSGLKIKLDVHKRDRQIERKIDNNWASNLDDKMTLEIFPPEVTPESLYDPLAPDEHCLQRESLQYQSVKQTVTLDSGPVQNSRNVVMNEDFDMFDVVKGLDQNGESTSDDSGVRVISSSNGHNSAIDLNAAPSQTIYNPEIKAEVLPNETGKQAATLMQEIPASPKVDYEQHQEIAASPKADNKQDRENTNNAGKEEKAMKVFKIALVELVKEILKPKWKEGQMTRDVHKTIVKKTVDKVSSTIAGDQIPNTQEKITHYLSSSKPKINKLIQAYVDRLSKTAA